MLSLPTTQACTAPVLVVVIPSQVEAALILPPMNIQSDPFHALMNPFDIEETPQEELPGSVSILISRVKEGDEESVRVWWNRYSGALVRAAQSRMSKQVAAKVGSEDLAQSVFFAIYRGAVKD